MINPNADVKFFHVCSESLDDLTMRMSKNNDILENQGYTYNSSNIFSESLPLGVVKYHAVLIYKKKETNTVNE